MPVYLRSFYYKKLVEAKKKESEEINKARKKSSQIQRPNIQSSRFNR